MLNFQEFALGVNLAIFAGAAVFVFLAGSKLAGYAEAIAERTGLNQAFIGALLLGVATSLPELATTITGSIIGNARLVTANLFGGVAMQIAILAFVDIVALKKALTKFTPQPILLLQGVMLLLLLATALAGVAAGDPISFFGVGLTPVFLLGGYLFTLRISHRPELAPRWQALDSEETITTDEKRDYGDSNFLLYTFTSVISVIILVAGWTLAKTGDALSSQTGLGATFVGVTLVAISTSLPEISTALGAVRRGNHEMAVGNILGTNCLEVALFVVADAIYRKGAILAAVDRSSMFAATLGMIMTAIYLVGLLERRDRTILRMGVDSFAVLVVYLLGLGMLYYLK
jgi:cation:H+ antiporter